MDLNYPEDFYSNISTLETSHHDLLGTARSYECIFCKRGFTTAQALGGHMNIHRKQRANNNTKPTVPPPSTSNKVDAINNHADLVQIPTQSTPSHANHLSFPPTSLTVTPSHAQLSSAEKDQLGHVFLQDWSTTNLSFYSNPLCLHQIKNKFEDTEENGLDLELRLGHHP
ncbi:transcriptional regulator SUPERMAN-like [Vigna umbellata]|uniref:transcriptional regulator SUPERMAN-like n=1 Tax=Vigna umbellata TaxID=87088 RepID=UPI001F5E7D69|nr:transcriptional regulator SUPERMAN-like [Vigna umbellata]